MLIKKIIKKNALTNSTEQLGSSATHLLMSVIKLQQISVQLQYPLVSQN